MWMFPKIVVPPNHASKNRVFHYFHHPFWGVSLFLETPTSAELAFKTPSFFKTVEGPLHLKIFFCSIRFSEVVSTHLWNTPLNLYQQAIKGFLS